LPEALSSTTARTGEMIDEELEQVREQPDVRRPVEVVLGDGYSWREAMGRARWSLGDLLLVGSSSHGPLTSVFLGSRASKIIRYAPVPVLTLPRAHS
jgi:nucleotide-binding universal stress UspA family protein